MHLEAKQPTQTGDSDKAQSRRWVGDQGALQANSIADSAAPVAARTHPSLRHAPDKDREATPSEKVYNFILDKILTREWPIHSKIMTESELCIQLEVSRIAVREAVERFSALGLLVKKQGSGTFVTEPNIDNWLGSMFPMILTSERDLRQLLEFRRYFEYGNVVLFMRYASPDNIAALEQNYQEMIALSVSDPKRAGVLDYEFHQIIARGTKNKFIMKISDILIEIMRSHQEAMFYNSISLGNAIIYHNEVVRAMRNGDDEVAAMLMRRHIDIAIEYYEKGCQQATAGTGQPAPSL